MKALSSSFLVLLFFFQTSSLLAQDPADKVIVYSDDFGGSKVELGPGKYDYMYLVRSGTMAVKSLKVPKGLKVTIYERDNFEGGSVTITENIRKAQLEAKGFGKLSMNVSLVVEKIPAGQALAAGSFVTIYRDDFSGASKDLAAGRYDFHDLGEVDNDQLSSVKIPTGLKVTLYEHGGFKGRSLSLTTDTRAAFLVSNKFNDITSSIWVEQAIVKPGEEKQESPVVAPLAVTGATVAVTETAKTQTTTEIISDPTEPIVYAGDFSGLSRSLAPGRYSSDQLGIGNNELSSIKVPKGFRVTLYDGDAFEGRSIVVTGDARASTLVDNNFNNATSSLLVEALPIVTIYEGDFNGVSSRLLPGRYAGHDFGIGNDQLSSVRVPAGLTITLYEDENFGGNKLTLTKDTGYNSLNDQGFNNATSSIVVAVAESVAPMVTIFRDDFSGISKKLPAGQYNSSQLGIGSDMLSSIQVPRGFQVVLYEHESFQGRMMTLRADANMKYFIENEFNDLVSSLVVEELSDLGPLVTVFADKFSGRSQSFAPGRYRLKDLALDDNQISSANVPSGMRLILYEDDDFKGYSLTVEKDIDLAVSRAFDKRASSIIVEDAFVPSVTPVKPPEVAPTVTTAPTTQTQSGAGGGVAVAAVVAEAKANECHMNDAQFQTAYNAVKSKGFSSDMMTTAKLSTKDRCLDLQQIKSIATLFMDDEYTLEFVKYAYPLSSGKQEYYTLEGLFKFMSTRDEFNKFLQTK